MQLLDLSIVQIKCPIYIKFIKRNWSSQIWRPVNVISNNQLVMTNQKVFKNDTLQETAFLRQMQQIYT